MSANGSGTQWRIQDLQTGGGKVERRRRENRGAEGARIEAPFPVNFSILSLKMATFSTFWALFLQFIVHSSMECVKRFRRQKPLLFGKLAVVCMQIALGDKISMLETTL